LEKPGGIVVVGACGGCGCGSAADDVIVGFGIPQAVIDRFAVVAITGAEVDNEDCSGACWAILLQTPDCTGATAATGRMRFFIFVLLLFLLLLFWMFGELLTDARFVLG